MACRMPRDAFRKVWHDPELLETAKEAGRTVHYIGAKESERLIKDALEQPPQLATLLKEAYGVKD